MGTFIDLGKHRILAIANPLRARTLADSAGQCLSSSLELASRVHEATGVRLQLLRWRVQGDPHYCDHWAVAWEKGHAIDLTRIQVDGKLNVLMPLADYPAHYGTCSRYPSELLLPGFRDEHRGSREGRLSSRFMRQCIHRVFCADLEAAWSARSLAGVAGAVAASASYWAWFVFRELRTLLERRVDRLSQRLQEAHSFSDHEHVQPAQEPSRSTQAARPAAPAAHEERGKQVA